MGGVSIIFGGTAGHGSQLFPGGMICSKAARAFSSIASHRRSIGHPISQADAQIAAIARVHRAELATRNLADFADCGIKLVDPWNAR
jgi:predicted nucleic acid-binding protein